MDKLVHLPTGGIVPTDVRAEQTGFDIILVTWTPPPAPAAGYQVQVTVGTTTTTTDVTGTNHTISVDNQLGVVYSITVASLSQYLPSEASAPVRITVRGTIYVWIYVGTGKSQYCVDLHACMDLYYD